MKHTFETSNLRFKSEDGGQALIATLDGGMHPDDENGLFVRVQSWDDQKEHAEARLLEGKEVRVTVEEVKQPIYEHKVGYELGMGDFLIQQAQRLQFALDGENFSDVYEALQQLKKRIGTTPYTPDGCRLPYYPI